MKPHRFAAFCCVFAACVEASSGLEVDGHLGGEVSILCAGNWTANSSREHGGVYFCKGACSRGNVLIQTEGGQSALARRGRYTVEMDSKDQVFIVTIKNLRSSDAGLYHCGVGTRLNALHQDPISLNVLDAPTVHHGPPPTSTDTPQSGADAVLRGSFLSGSETSAATLTPPPASERRNQRGESKLTGTTVVIIVSGSLAFLVCAIIPLIFYGHWRSSPADDQNRHGSKDEGDCNEQTADVTSDHVAVGLQSLEPKVETECGAQDSSQYAAIYQALDPKTLE